MDLDRLIETERRNEDLIRRTRDDAAALVLAAHDEVRRLDAALAAELAAQARAAEATAAAERERRLASIRADGQRQAARFDAVDDPRVQQVAQALVDTLVAGGSAT